MTPETVIGLGTKAIEVLMLVAAPMLLAALIIGLVISIFQAATQINEATLSFIPKLVGILLAMALLGPWTLTVLIEYTANIIASIPMLAR